MMELLEIWSKIVEEASEAQISFGENRGLVNNFLLNDVYLRESAFAAKIFATEYKRTGKKEYLYRAQSAIDALQTRFNSGIIQNGMDEPTWTPRGIRQKKGSIPATVLLIYALDDACEIISHKFEYNILGIFSFLEQCYLGNGKFYHDKVDKGNKSHQNHVVNTTAMAYFFLKFANSKGYESSFFRDEIEKIECAIMRSQREDGFWSYIEPGRLQVLFWKIRKIMPNLITNVYNRLFGDRSIFFGDAMHDVIVPYYFLAGKYKTSEFSLEPEKRKILLKGVDFVKKNLISMPDGGIKYDFSWEPKPMSPRYCGFLSSSTYFYILDFLDYMQIFNLITKEESEKYIAGLIKYIKSHLVQSGIPSINPYDGEDIYVENILPRPAESVFDKGSLLANLIVKREINSRNA